MTPLELPTVTLCAVTSINLAATVAAIAASMEQVRFSQVLLLTDSTTVQLPAGARLVRIDPLRSGHDYSDFMLRRLADHIHTDHCLIVQWDGFVVDATAWDDQFLQFDYLGASWPHFSDGHDVGNGGFSLRSRKLLEACRSPAFKRSHPEDVAIGRVNREWLEREHGIRFADAKTASRFSFERAAVAGPTFGFHGIFNMIPLLGVERFWSIYEELDDPSTAIHDYGLLMRQLGSRRGAARRRFELTMDFVRSRIGKNRRRQP